MPSRPWEDLPEAEPIPYLRCPVYSPDGRTLAFVHAGDIWLVDPEGGEARLVNPAGVDDRDHYDRLLRYVHDSGRDTGLSLIKLGLAKARYDGRDGYDRHPRQSTYRRADRNNPDLCR